MDRIRIEGGVPLKGALRIGGAKNAALPLMCTALLTDEPLRLSNVPMLADIDALERLLESLGVAIEVDAPIPGDGRLLQINAAKAENSHADYELVRKMRASVLVLGPLLARLGRAEVSLPGGCAIGARPVDLHLKALQQLGAEIELRNGYIHAAAPQGLVGATIRFPFVSVGATENTLMAAVLARGTTVIENAAREPEIADLAQCLVAMGARIEGIGSETLTVHGVARLHGASYEVMPDRIETGTYAMAAAITGGDVELIGGRRELIGAVGQMLEDAGAELSDTARGVRVKRAGNRLKAVDITTAPFPGFATDLQAQAMAAMSLADGASCVTETIFENRFMHVPELMRMGADIQIKGETAVVRGVDRLMGAPVMATDLRASVCLVLAGLAAEGETVVARVYHLDRGYERLEQKLAGCGARIERLHG
jgi:UDP-N-acetylglucosamine 1-carboxyvinyltransferase